MSAQVGQAIDVGDPVIGPALNDEDIPPPVAPCLQRGEERLGPAPELRSQPLRQLQALGHAHGGQRRRLIEGLFPSLQERRVGRRLQRPADAAR